LRAELFVEDDAERSRHSLVSRFDQVRAFRPLRQLAIIRQIALVGLEEMPRVREPGAHHALIAGDDGRAAVAGRDIGDQQETVRERAGAHRAARSISGWRGWWRGSPRAAARESSSNAPISTTGHSTSPATSSSSASSSISFKPCAKARSRASWAMMRLAAVGVEHDLGPSSSRCS
jgi:hypothetical protein